MPTESHVAAFVRERLQTIDGTSIAFSELWSALRSLVRGAGPPAALDAKVRRELKVLGYGKYKSCCLMRYRGLQLAARSDGSHAVTLHPNSNLRDEGYFEGPAKDRQKTINSREVF
jgi:hypothetical protein